MEKPKTIKTTAYFREQVLRKRSYIKLEWCAKILLNPIYTEIQEGGRIRFWGYIEDIEKYLRVITLSDGETIHNVFPDRNFQKSEIH